MFPANVFERGNFDLCDCEPFHHKLVLLFSGIDDLIPQDQKLYFVQERVTDFLVAQVTKRYVMDLDLTSTWAGLKWTRHGLTHHPFSLRSFLLCMILQFLGILNLYVQTEKYYHFCDKLLLERWKNSSRQGRIALFVCIK